MKQNENINQKRVNEKMDVIRKAVAEDTYHLDNIPQQLDTLSLIVGHLLATNENGVNNRAIGSYHHVGLSLKLLESILKPTNNEHRN